MDKTAQRRSLLNKLHEMANVPARSAEEFFKPEMKRVMKTLTDADDVVRATLLGDKVGNAIPEDKVPVKSLLKEAKTFINRREYMSAIASLGRFHKKMSDVAEVLKNLNLNVDSLHHKFLFEKLPTDQRRHLQGLRERLGAQQNNLTKEAGIMDFFHNIGTQRGRALAAWEKRYPKEVAPIRDGALSQLESSQGLLDQIVGLLKEMASYRASRRIDNYLETAKQVVVAFNRYDAGKNGFRTFYTEVVKPRLERLEAEEKQPDPAIPVPDPSQAGQQDAGGAPKDDSETSTAKLPPAPGAFAPPADSTSPTVLPPPSSVSNIPIPLTPGKTDPSPPPQFTPSPGAPEEKLKSEEVAQQLGWGKSSDFFHILESLSEEDPRIVASIIRKHASSIQEQDPITAIKLFNIARSLRG